MWQGLGLGAVILFSIYFTFGIGTLVGTIGRKEDRNESFLIGLGLGLLISGGLGLMVTVGLVA